MDRQKAVDDCNARIAADKNDVEAYIQRAKCQISLDQHSKAIKDLDIAADLAPDNDKVYYFRGLAYVPSNDVSL